MFIPGRNEIAVGFSEGSSNNLDCSVSYIFQNSALFDINFELYIWGVIYLHVRLLILNKFLAIDLFCIQGLLLSQYLLL